MNTKEVFHLWANESKPSAKSGNVFFEGPTVYSYGHHFPIAKLAEIDGEQVVFFNPDKYSVTTTGHQSLAFGAVHSRTRYHLVPRLWDGITSKSTLEKALEEQAKLNAFNADALKVAKAANAKRARERKAAEKKAQAEFPQRLEEWKACALHSLPFANQKPVYLRLIENGKRIETSRGAIIPTAAAVKAWTLIQRAENDPAFDWGNYKGLTVWGNPGEQFLQVGCHNIPLREVEEMARVLKIA